MVTIDSIRRPIIADIETFETFVRDNISAEGDLLHEMLTYTLTSRGKGVRPMLTMLAASMITASGDETAEEWMVWVIDLSVYTPEAAGANGYTVNSEQTVKFRITTGNAKSAENVGDYVEGSNYAEDPFYLDVAYFAIVDTIDEAKGMITDESYTLFANGLDQPGEEQSK